MAKVYLARVRDGRGKIEIALKRLSPDLQDHPDFVRMFTNEARIASRLVHDNILEVYEFGELDGSLFMAMELLHGVDLAQLAACMQEQGVRIPTDLAVNVACKVLEALDYTHNYADERGRWMEIVHCDVSPHNIILTFDGRVKLVDFGVATTIEDHERISDDMIRGKFGYMAPEQLRGDRLDARADLFAFGEVFYELLLGQHPFYAESDEQVIENILAANVPHPTAIDQSFSADLADVFMRCLRRDPSHRFDSAASAVDALSPWSLHGASSALRRFLAECFPERVHCMQEARRTGNDRLLLQALASADLASDQGAPPVSHDAPTERPRTAPRRAERVDVIPPQHNHQRVRPKTWSGTLRKVENFGSYDGVSRAHSVPGRKKMRSVLQGVFDDPED